MLYRICRKLLQLIYALFFPLKAVGLHHIPAEGPVLLCSNHISYFDPPTVGIKVNRKVHYMAKAELFSFRPLAVFFRALGAFPVKRGGVSKDSIRQAINLLKAGQVMGIFPEGTRNSAEGMGKKGAAMIALRSGAVAVPVAIIGNYKLFRSMKVVYGKAIDLSEFAGDSSSDVLDRATDKIMSAIRELHRAG